MNTSSILTNSSALAALQSLDQTEQALNTTQNQISTGLSVATASDNAAYWSIGTQLSSDSGVINSINDSLAQSQSAMDTATSALTSIITTINSISSALAEATNPGADIAQINTTLQVLGQQLTDAVAGASFDGLNLLDGSQTGALNFVAGLTQNASGGSSFNTIAFTAQSLTGSATTNTSTTTQPEITSATTISELNGLADNHSATLSYGQDVVNKTSDTTGDTFSVESQALNGTVTTTTYTGLSATGNVVQATNAVAFGVSVTTTPPAGLLTQNGDNLTNLVTSATNASAQHAAVAAALAAVTSYASVIGSTQDRMTAASTLNSALSVDYQNGASALVDADMNEASTRLNALQTQQQLGIQSLSIANQNSQLILKLFQS